MTGMRFRTVATLAIAVAILGTADGAQAKIACGGTHPAAEIQVRGLPNQPLADVEYQLSLIVPRAPHANPWPIAMFARCNPSEFPGFNTDLPGAGRVEVPLRFPEPGNWRGAVMDRGGMFHSLGTFEVGSFDSLRTFDASETTGAPPDERDSAGMPAGLIGAAIGVSLCVLLVAWFRVGRSGLAAASQPEYVGRDGRGPGR